MSSSSRCASRRREWLLAAAALALPAAWAQATGLPELPGWTQRRQASLRTLGFRIYDVALWSPEPVAAAAWDTQALALALTYARAFEGRLLAERSLTEMRRQGPLDEALAQRWLKAMSDAFPDVSEGDRLTGRHDPQRGARFWFNGEPRGSVDDAAFSRRFFGIWLSPQTSEPGLRGRLLGLAP